MYCAANNPVGAAPLPLDLRQRRHGRRIRRSPNVGQIRSEVGLSTGFVVRPRVAATAGHVVFDHGMLESPQRAAVAFRAAPRRPRTPSAGAARTVPVAGGIRLTTRGRQPGRVSGAITASAFHVRCIFWKKPAAAATAVFWPATPGWTTEFLDSTAEKILAGYAHGRDSRGGPRAGGALLTAAFSTALTPAYRGNRGRHHGGARFGRMFWWAFFCPRSNGFYFPAAIYLKGVWGRLQ